MCYKINENLTVPTGQDGADGTNGTKGTNGTNGLNAPQILFGVVDPVYPTLTPTSDPAFYINSATYDVWSYASTVWLKKIQGFEAWNDATLLYSGTYINDSSNPLKYRIEGKNCRIYGMVNNSAHSAAVATRSTLMTLPLTHYPSIVGSVYETCIDYALKKNVFVEITSSGVVKLMGDFITFDNQGVFIDITYPIA